MNSVLQSQFRKLETTDDEIISLRFKGLDGLSEQDVQALGRKITRVRQAARAIHIFLNCGDFVKEILKYDRHSGRITVRFEAGGIETFQL